MNKHITQPVLKLFLLIIFALTSSCAPLTAVPSPTATPAPSQTPTATVTPSPTNTPEPIHPEDTIFYSDINTLYSVDLQSQKTNIVLSSDDLTSDYLITTKFIYTRLKTNKSNQENADWEIFKMNVDGSQLEQLTTGGALEGFHTDPDEKYLTYSNYDRALKIVNIADKTSEVIATPSNSYSEWVWADSWSPDGKKLSYRRVINPANNEICSLFIYDVATKKSTKLMGDGCTAIWSPDGKNILFTASRVFTKGGDICSLFIYDVTLKKYTELAGVGCIAAWSPDGKNILFTANKEQELEIGILDMEHGKTNYVPVGGRSFFSGAWSRNHEQFLMAVFDEQNQTYLYLFDWETVSVSLISKIGRLQNPLHFSWSPNGDMVLYEQEEPSLSYKHYLYLLDIKKNKITNLYTLLGLDAHFDYWWNYSPTWSPDGKYFAYFTMSSGDIDYEQDFVLNIKSIETEGNIQIQVPRKGSSIRMFWINDEIESEN